MKAGKTGPKLNGSKIAQMKKTKTPVQKAQLNPNARSGTAKRRMSY